MTNEPTPEPYNDPAQPLHVLTLWQPWASLMAWGEKTVETRPRRWGCLKWVAIHAAASTPRITPTDPDHFPAAMKRHGDPERIPEGEILAVVRVFVVLPADAANVSPKERAFGDYRPGRWAYFTTDLGALPEPIRWKGAQGLQVAPLALREQIAEALRK